MADVVTTSSLPTRIRRAGSLLARGLFGARKFLEGVLGADKYEHYLVHHRTHHPGVEPMDVREFWRDYADWQDRNPQGRCC